MTQDYVNVTPKKERWFWPKLKTKKAQVFFWLTIFLSPLCYWVCSLMFTLVDEEDTTAFALLLLNVIVALVARCFARHWGWYLGVLVLTMAFYSVVQKSTMYPIAYASFDTGVIVKAVPAKENTAYLVFIADQRDHKLYSQLIHKDVLKDKAQMTRLHRGQKMYALFFSDTKHGVAYHFNWWPKHVAFHPGNENVVFYTETLLKDNWNW